MATKWNNSRLLIVFVILIGIFLAVRYFNSSKIEGNFDPNVISLDTAGISEILLYPKVANHEEIKLFKENGQWMVQKGEFKTRAMPSTVNSLINTILNIKPTRLAARDESKWEKFHVNDSLATKIKVVQKDATELGIMIGKFSYKQAPQRNPNQGPNIKSLSYFRMEGEKEVYATEGFLTMTFNRDLNSFRDQTFLKTNKENINKLNFSLSADSSYLLQEVDSVWMIDGVKASQDKVGQLLSKLAMNNQNQFADDFEAGSRAKSTLLIQGDNMDEIRVKAFEYDSTTVIMQSSLNEDAMFKIPRSGLYNELFKPAEFYLDSARVE